MFKVSIIGLKNIDYKRKADGKQISGKEFYYAHEPISTDKPNVTGLVTGSAYVSGNSELYSQLTSDLVGKECELVYEFDGKYTHLTGIKLIKASA